MNTPDQVSAVSCNTAMAGLAKKKKRKKQPYRPLTGYKQKNLKIIVYTKNFQHKVSGATSAAWPHPYFVSASVPLLAK